MDITLSNLLLCFDPNTFLNNKYKKMFYKITNVTKNIKNLMELTKSMSQIMKLVLQNNISFLAELCLVRYISNRWA